MNQMKFVSPELEFMFVTWLGNSYLEIGQLIGSMNKYYHTGNTRNMVIPPQK